MSLAIISNAIATFTKPSKEYLVAAINPVMLAGIREVPMAVYIAKPTANIKDGTIRKPPLMSI